MTQFRGNVTDTKKRVTESESRVDTKLGGFIGKKYWCALQCLNPVPNTIPSYVQRFK